MSRHLRHFIPVVLVLLLLGRIEEKVWAHPLAPALLDVEEVAGGRVEVRWKTSSLKIPGTSVEPILPQHCKVLGNPVASEQIESLQVRWTMDCAPRGLAGSRVGFSGLADSKTDALIRVKLADGRVLSAVVRAEEPFLNIPGRESALAVLRSYARLGVAEVLGGLDHLLLVFGLVLLVAGAKSLLKTAAAFTVGHSLTLSLTTLGIVNLPRQPIAVLIALSVFLLAVELSRSADSRPTPLRRFPGLVAGVFGLLHGLGFAGALADVAAPQTAIPMALFSFNAGIEVGQIALIAAVVVARSLFRTMRVPLPHWLELVPLYAMGSLAACWCLQRAAAMFA